MCALQLPSCDGYKRIGNEWSPHAGGHKAETLTTVVAVKRSNKIGQWGEKWTVAADYIAPKAHQCVKLRLALSPPFKTKPVFIKRNVFVKERGLRADILLQLQRKQVCPDVCHYKMIMFPDLVTNGCNDLYKFCASGNSPCLGSVPNCLVGTVAQLK